MYDYPIDYSWSTDEMIDVIALYNAVEKAYEEGISQSEFMDAYQRFVQIVDLKSEQKKWSREFEKVSHYSIDQVFQQAKEHDWIKMS